MWVWIASKFQVVFGFVVMGIILLYSFKRHGKDEEKLKGEKEKSKRQEIEHETQNETFKAVNNVKNENDKLSDSNIVDKLRSKWQRD